MSKQMKYHVEINFRDEMKSVILARHHTVSDNTLRITHIDGKIIVYPLDTIANYQTIEVDDFADVGGVIDTEVVTHHENTYLLHQRLNILEDQFKDIFESQFEGNKLEDPHEGVSELQYRVETLEDQIKNISILLRRTDKLEGQIKNLLSLVFTIIVLGIFMIVIFIIFVFLLYRSLGIATGQA